MRVVAFMSRKGGVGKSTACVNIAAALGSLSRRVLLLDLDSNSCTTRALMTGKPEAEAAGMLLGEVSITDPIVQTVIPGVSLIPGSGRLYAIARMAPVDAARLNADGSGALGHQALNVALGELPPNAFDYLLLDCPAGSDFMDWLALVTATDVAVPCGLSVYDLYGLQQTFHLIRQAQTGRGGLPKFLGLLPVAVSKAGLPENIRTAFESMRRPILSSIRRSDALKTMPGAERVEKRVMVTARPRSPVTDSFVQVALEIDLGIDAARALHPPADDGDAGVSVDDGDMAAAAETAAVSETNA